MVVSRRQQALLPAEALAASVVLARITPAIAAPVAERFGERLELRPIGQHATSLAHGNVVSGIEAARGQVAERADRFAFKRRSGGVAAVLDQPQPMLCGE